MIHNNNLKMSYFLNALKETIKEKG
jgi:hypothetical protein